MSTAPVVLFLCSGNHYRSRFAEELFNARARERALPWRADSAGLSPECFAENPGPIARITLDALRERGIEPAPPYRLPRAVSARELERATRVIALKEAEHRPILERRFAELAPKVEYWHVHDVDHAPPAEMIPALEARVLALIDELVLTQ